MASIPNPYSGNQSGVYIPLTDHASINYNTTTQTTLPPPTTTTTPDTQQPQYTYVIHSTTPLTGLDNIHATNIPTSTTTTNSNCLFNLHTFQFILFLIPCLLAFLTFTSVLFRNGYSEYVGSMGFGMYIFALLVPWFVCPVLFALKLFAILVRCVRYPKYSSTDPTKLTTCEAQIARFYHIVLLILETLWFVLGLVCNLFGSFYFFDEDVQMYGFVVMAWGMNFVIFVVAALQWFIFKEAQASCEARANYILRQLMAPTNSIQFQHQQTQSYANMV